MSLLAGLVLLGVVIVILSGASYMILEDSRAIFPGALFGVLLASGALTFSEMSKPNDPASRFISADEKRAAKMFGQNCKQVNYIQANSTTGLGLGLSAKGSPMVGAISSTNEDTYVYSCDSGTQYSLTYDIEKYRKYYK